MAEWHDREDARAGSGGVAGEWGELGTCLQPQRPRGRAPDAWLPAFGPGAGNVEARRERCGGVAGGRGGKVARASGHGGKGAARRLQRLLVEADDEAAVGPLPELLVGQPAAAQLDHGLAGVQVDQAAHAW